MGLTLAYGGLFFDHELKLFQKYRHLAYHGKNRRIRKKNMKKVAENNLIKRSEHLKRLIYGQFGVPETVLDYSDSTKIGELPHNYIYPYL